MIRRHRTSVLWFLLAVLGLTALWGVSSGAVPISWGDIFSFLGKKTGLAAGAGPVSNELVLWELRVPRVLMAGLIGAALALAGAVLQGLFRNPLADPALIGISTGAAVGAVLVIVLGHRLVFLHWLGDMWMLPVSAFLGALLATLAIHRIATSGGYTSVATLLLAGVAVNALGSAVIGFCTYLASDAQLRSISFWMMGSLGAASWSVLGVIAPFCIVALAFIPRFARALNAMALGEAEAGHLGFNPERVKRWLIVLSSVAVGASVAYTGIIGFIGLVTPHLVRLLIGPDHRWLLPGSMLLGAILMMAADMFSRTMVSPAELPVGIVTAAVGAPFFLGLLWRQRKKIVAL
jgi:iron complex transport system permease protein